MVKIGYRMMVVAAALGIGSACTSSSQPTASGGAPGAAPAAFSMPMGGGCQGEVTRFQAVLQSDVNTGNVARSVYNRAEPDLTRAATACQLGRESEAMSILAATKSRFGYR